MTIKIEINAESAQLAREEMANLLGLRRIVADAKPEAVKSADTLLTDAMALQDKPISDIAKAVNEEKPKRGRPKAKAEPQIRTNPENRQPESDPETDAQDDADEAEESETESETHDEDKEDGAQATRLDVKDAMMKYVEKFGMDAVQEDAIKILEAVFPGKGYTKQSDIPDDPALFKRFIDGAVEAVAKNPFKRKPV